MPPHRGHEFLIDFAREYAQRLTVLVCSLRGDPIPGALRYDWLRAMYPSVRIVHISDDLPQEPGEHPRFWEIWRDVIRAAHPEPLEYIFASEPYGQPLADAVGAAFVPVDIGREIVPISASAIRAAPLRHWEFIPPAVRPHFVKRIAIVGPESTGKSTLARMLAQRFDTVHVWEYARPLLDPKGGRCDPEDIPRILRGQAAAEQALARQANRLLFCDTDALTTLIWNRLLFGSSPPWLEAAARAQYDLTLLLDVDVPWVDDQQRFYSEPEKRREIFGMFRKELEARGRRYQVVSGPWNDRFQAAAAAVESILQEGIS